jgi:hypothetical protein
MIDQNIINFEPITKFKKGILSSILLRGFAGVCDEKIEKKIIQFDIKAFENLQTVGACVFISNLDGKPVGTASWDPRKAPELAEIGWNCVFAGI